MGPLHLQSEEELQIQLNVHILATTCFSRLYIKRALQDETSRILINTSSINAYLKPAYLSIYNASKSYIASFSETLGEEMKKLNRNIRIVVTTPGPVETKLVRGLHFQEGLLITPEEHVKTVVEEIQRSEGNFLRLAGSEIHEKEIRKLERGERSRIVFAERRLERYFEKMKKGVKVV